MLILAARVQAETAKLRAAADAIDGVEPGLVGPAIVIDERLPKMKAVPQGQAGDALEASVDSLARVGEASAVGDFVAKLALERGEDFIRLRIALDTILLRGLVDHPLNASPGPRTQAEERGIEIPEPAQSVESRVNPAIHRNIGVGRPGSIGPCLALRVNN